VEFLRSCPATLKQNYKQGEHPSSSFPQRELRFGHAGRLFCIVLYVAAASRIINSSGPVRNVRLILKAYQKFAALKLVGLERLDIREKTHETAA